MFGRALSQTPTEDLEILLRFAHQGKIDYPVTRKMLLLMGMNRMAEMADILFGLDERGTRAVLIAVLAERREQARQAEEREKAQTRAPDA